MQLKKNPRARLEKFSKIFTEIGLVLALFIVYQLLEVKTFDRSIGDNLGDITMVDLEKEDVPIVKREEITLPKNVPPPPTPEKITVIEDDDDIEETIIDNTETDEDEAVVAKFDSNDIVEVEEDEEIIEDIPFMIIEDAPVYPGCSGTNEQLKACFTENIRDFFTKRFNSGLAQELGLSPGKKRIIVIFRVDKTGSISDVQARAPHPRIQKEVIQIIKDLPQMTPGKQRGSPVGVKYSLPIMFIVK